MGRTETIQTKGVTFYSRNSRKSDIPEIASCRGLLNSFVRLERCFRY